VLELPSCERLIPGVPVQSVVETDFIIFFIMSASVKLAAVRVSAVSILYIILRTPVWREGNPKSTPNEVLI
jgi:hypothetical protein